MPEPSREQQIEVTRRYRAALQLIWSIHVRRHVHLGYERASGIETRCIPCIAASALGNTHDGIPDPEMLEAEIDKVRAEECGGAVPHSTCPRCEQLRGIFQGLLA